MTERLYTTKTPVRAIFLRSMEEDESSDSWDDHVRELGAWMGDLDWDGWDGGISFLDSDGEAVSVPEGDWLVWIPGTRLPVAVPDDVFTLVFEEVPS